MKKILLLSALCCAVFTFSQKKETYIKGNLLVLPLGMLNVGVEHQFSEHITGQADVFFSPWKSFAGHRALFGIATLEGRYYFDKAFHHWYVGVNAGFGAYNIQKWNYWKSGTYVDKETHIATPYRMDQLYQKGFSYIFGATVGYQFQVGNRWNMDLYLGGGWHNGFYKGYVEGMPEVQNNRYDSVEHWDKSGEWIPYKAGIMISYKL